MVLSEKNSAMINFFPNGGSKKEHAEVRPIAGIYARSQWQFSGSEVKNNHTWEQGVGG